MSAAPVCVKCGCCPAYEREGEAATLCLFCEDGLPCAGEQRRRRAEKLAALRDPGTLRKQEKRKADPPRHELKKAEEKRTRKARLATRAKAEPRRIKEPGPTKPSQRLCFCGEPITDLKHARFCLTCRTGSARPHAKRSAPREPQKKSCEICSTEFVGGKKRRYCDDCIAKLQATAKSGKPHPNLKYSFTPQQDARIRELYARRLVERTSVKGPLAIEFGIPSWRISSRARELGLARVKEKPWSQIEVELLQRHAWKSDGIISKILQTAGFRRTATAVHVMLKRRVGRKSEQYPFYSATALARLMGIDAHAITGWIAQGWLRARKRATERTEQQGGDPHEIWPYDVYEFIRAHPEEIDLRKVDQGWILDLLLNPEKRIRPEPRLVTQVDAAIARTFACVRQQLRTTAEVSA
jgi:hypothetical protein